MTERSSQSLWTDPKVLLPLVNIGIAILGFVSVYSVTTTKLEDAVITNNKETAAIRLEIVEIHRRAQNIADSLVQDRGLTANRLTAIEVDLKYISRAIDEIKNQGHPSSQKRGEIMMPDWPR